MTYPSHSIVLQFSHDTKAIHERHIALAKRQTVGSSGFTDEHYPTFYGGDFGNVTTILCLHELIAETSHRVPSYSVAVSILPTQVRV